MNFIDAIAEQGLVLYYSNQCPHTAKYVPLVAEVASRYGVTLEVHKKEFISVSIPDILSALVVFEITFDQADVVLDLEHMETITL